MKSELIRSQHRGRTVVRSRTTSLAQIDASSGATDKPHLKRYLRAVAFGRQSYHEWICSLVGTRFGRGKTPQQAYDEWLALRVLDVRQTTLGEDH